jgi:branched-chain amino acid aminotransferase
LVCAAARAGQRSGGVSMAIVVYVNGRISGERDAVVSVLDHGFLYGEGVYEVVRTYDRKPFLFGRHLQRLRRSAQMIALDVPYSDAELTLRLQETTAAFYEHPENRTVADVYVRMLVTRGVGDISYDPSSCRDPSLVIIVKPLVGLAREVYERGVKVVIASVVRNHPCSINPLIKSNNLLNNALAAQEAFRRGAFDAVLRNYRGEIAECSIANLFVVKNGTLWTPPIEAGLLSGITRGFVFELCPGAGVPFEQKVLHDADLFEADESFLTSSTQEVVPVVQVDDRPIGDGRPGPVTRHLLEAYRARVREIIREP